MVLKWHNKEDRDGALFVEVLHIGKASALLYTLEDERELRNPGEVFLYMNKMGPNPHNHPCYKRVKREDRFSQLTDLDPQTICPKCGGSWSTHSKYQDYICPSCRFGI